MEKKIDLDTLKEILRDHLEDSTQAEILKEINQALLQQEQEEVKEKTKNPPIEKKGIVILSSLPQNLDRKDLEQISGFFTEIPTEDHISSLREKIQGVHAAYQQSKKSKKCPANTLGDLMEFAPAKLLKEVGILKKPKGSLQFFHLPNQL